MSLFRNLLLHRIQQAASPSLTVTFDSDGGTFVAAQSIRRGQSAALPAPPEKEGYLFSGWYRDNALFDFATPVMENMTLTARWIVRTFTVSFDKDNGTGVLLQTVNWGEHATVPLPPTKTGYVFLGWYVGDTSFDFSAPVYSDLTITAKWYASGPPSPPLRAS